MSNGSDYTRKIKQYLKNIQDKIAPELGFKRFGVLKTEKVDWTDCKKLIQYADYISKCLASMGYRKLAIIIRKYKIDMKNIYEYYYKQLKSNEAANTLRLQGTYHQRCILAMIAVAAKIIETIKVQAQNLQDIYFELYKFFELLNGSTPQQIPPLPEAGCKPDFEKLDNIQVPQSIPQNIKMSTYEPPPRPSLPS